MGPGTAARSHASPPTCEPGQELTLLQHTDSLRNTDGPWPYHAGCGELT